MKRSVKNYFSNLIFPAFIFGALSGVLTAVVVVLFKFLANYAVHASQTVYTYLKGAPYFIPLALLILFGLAVLLSNVYKKHGNLRGGGIPTSVGVIRGMMSFNWLDSLIGVFILSLITFVCGIALGTEGPSVQLGTAVGGGCVLLFPKRFKAWRRYSMTGGACAGFAVATGAPVSGILFALEEAHERISPMIFIVAVTSVLCSFITASILSPLFGVSVYLIPQIEHTVLQISEYYIPAIIGVCFGLYSVLFLRFYKFIRRLINDKLKKVKERYFIFFVLVLTLGLGLVSFSFVSTGHDLMLSLFEKNLPILMLALIIILRSLLTVGSNCSGLTGGVFLPILAIGTALSVLLAIALIKIFGIDESYYTLILALGISACIAGMMKMPLTAIVFAIEACSCYNNVLPVIICALLSFVVVEAFSTKCINECVLDDRLERLYQSERKMMFEVKVVVQQGAFAVGKQMRDILWPTNLHVLALSVPKANEKEGVAHGGRVIQEGDILRVKYATYHEEVTESELLSIVGEQKIEKQPINN